MDISGNNGNRRHELTPKQQEFFRQGRVALQRMNDQMNGALQFICAENNLQGKVTLSDDATCIIVEEQ